MIGISKIDKIGISVFLYVISLSFFSNWTVVHLQSQVNPLELWNGDFALVS